MKNFKGTNNPNFKNDKTHNNKCIDCGEHISYGGIRCKSCARIYQYATRPETHPFKDKHHSKKTIEKIKEKLTGVARTHGLSCKGKHYFCECGKEIEYRSKKCKICGGKSRRKPKTFCLDCKKELSRKEYIRCNKCNWIFYSGVNSPQLTHGETLKKHYCKCGKEISYTRERCWDCYCKWIKNPENHPNWQEGKSFEIYPQEWTNELKESIRQRDNHECQNCGMTEEEHIIVIGQDLHIHHVDYNKKNCKETNLITLCMSCNMRANFNRTYWENYYKEKLNKIINQSKDNQKKE